MNQSDNIDTPWDKEPIWIVTRTAFVAVTSFLDLFGNIVCLLVVPHLASIPDNNRMILTILSVSDLLIGVVVSFSLYPAATGKWPFSALFCQAIPLTIRTLLGISIACLMLMNVDRFVAITKPLHYHRLLTKKRILCVIGLIFIIGFAPALKPLPWKRNIVYVRGMCLCVEEPGTPNSHFNSADISGIMLIIIGLLITVFVYTKLFYITRIQLNKIHGRGETTGRRKLLRDTKALRMFFGFTITFIVSWMPIMVYIMYSRISGQTLSTSIYFFCYWAALSGSGLDVITLFITNSSFRRRAAATLTCVTCFSRFNNRVANADTTSEAFAESRAEDSP